MYNYTPKKNRGLKFNTYIVLSASMIWLVFGSMFLYRSFWKTSHAREHKQIITEHGIRHFLNSKQATVLTFRLRGLEDTLGIYRRDKKKYDYFLNHLNVGDTALVYFENWGLKKGDINTQIIHLESRGKILINFKDRRNRDLIISSILLLIGCGLLFLAYKIEKRKPFLQPYSLR
jgi:hypothetical protein